MPDHSNRPLGMRLVPPDRRTLKLERYIDIKALPPIPTVIDWTTKVPGWPMLLNDKLGCCVIAAMAHQEQADSAQNGRELTITDADVLAGYEAVGGYVPGNPATDNGCDPTVALNYWRQTGIAGNKVGAFASVDPTNEALVAAALYLFGGLFVGLALPLTAQTQNVWDVVGDGKTGKSAPASWGGHMVYLPARRVPHQYAVITWGEELALTQRFLATYSVQQTYAVIPQAWLNSAGAAPSGFNAQQLAADLAIVSGKQPPAPAADPYAPLWTWLAAVSAYELANPGNEGEVAEIGTVAQNAAAWAAAVGASNKPQLPGVPS